MRARVVRSARESMPRTSHVYTRYGDSGERKKHVTFFDDTRRYVPSERYPWTPAAVEEHENSSGPNLEVWRPSATTQGNDGLRAPLRDSKIVPLTSIVWISTHIIRGCRLASQPTSHHLPPPFILSLVSIHRELLPFVRVDESASVEILREKKFTSDVRKSEQRGGAKIWRAG